jgi:cytochrome c biogenesis protein CcmG, thiol:disulfide interchange protein DsbE
VAIALGLASCFVAGACTGTAAGCASGDIPCGPAASPAENASTAALLPASTTELPLFDPATFQRLLAQLRGTPAVVNLWASWCGPCRDEAPLLAEAARRYGSRVQFLGVDVLDARGSAQAFVAEYGWPYPSVYDPNGAIRDDLRFVGLPATVFVDRSGEIAGRLAAPLTRAVLQRRIDALLS